MKLVIKDLSVRLEKQPILQEVSLELEEGQFLSLLGPSGCGKSTLLKTVAGLLAPESGAVFLDGADITALAPHKRGTVILFQDIRLFPHMTAEENVAYPLKLQGVPKAERLGTARSLLEKVRLPGAGPRHIRGLSGGEQQRVALARALAARPRLLLLDEPFSALDENLREDMRALVLELHREFRMTTLLVTHDRQEALAMSDRLAVMAGGRILQTGTPRQVYDRPADRQTADYFGDCAYIPGAVQDGRFSGDGLEVAAPVADGSWDLGLRPGAWTLQEGGPVPLTVTALQYQGKTSRVTFTAPGGALLHKELEAPALVPGQVCTAALLPDRCLFFKKEGTV